MKIISSFLLLFLFTVVGYTNAQSEYDTKFIKKYKERYNANNINLSVVMSYAINDCNKICNKNDVSKLEYLAKSGNMFALAMLPFANGVLAENQYQLQTATKQSADKGEPYTAASYAMFQTLESKYDIAIKYSTIAMQKDFYDGYMRSAYIYQKLGDNTNFCSTLKNGYELFGFEFLSGYFINNDSEGAKLFFSKCTNKTFKDLRTKLGDEGKLVEGYINVKTGKYNESFAIFNQLYKFGDSSKISANAGYCLGKMYIAGKGVAKNSEKGEKLLKESFNNGVVYLDIKQQNGTQLPNILEIISYKSGNCSKIE